MEIITSAGKTLQLSQRHLLGRITQVPQEKKPSYRGPSNFHRTSRFQGVVLLKVKVRYTERFQRSFILVELALLSSPRA